MPDACLVFACGVEYLPLLHVQGHLLSSSSLWGLLGGSVVKASAYNAGDAVRSLGQEDPLEKEMATPSSIFAWEIPWREEPSGL